MPHIKTFDEEAELADKTATNEYPENLEARYAFKCGCFKAIGQRWYDKCIDEQRRHKTTQGDVIEDGKYFHAIMDAIYRKKVDTRENCFDEIEAIMHARAAGAEWCEKCRAYPCECKPDRCEFGCECGGDVCHV